MGDDASVWVIDTSSIVQIRRLVRADRRPKVFEKLDELVDQGTLVYPAQVVDEMKPFSDASSVDLPYEWAKGNQAKATRHGPQFEKVREILENPQVKRVLDAEKDSGEEADPYVLALAMFLKEAGYEATVITEDRKDRPDKLSMVSACGLLRLYCLSVEIFLEQRGIWRR